MRKITVANATNAPRLSKISKHDAITKTNKPDKTLEIILFDLYK